MRRKKLQWLELISTVRFDLEEGPVVDFTYPQENFSEEFIKKLAYPAFPDSYTLLCDDRMFFSFMMKAGPEDRKKRIYTFEDLDEQTMEAEVDEKVPQEGADSQQLIRDYNQTKKKQFIKGCDNSQI